MANVQPPAPARHPRARERRPRLFLLRPVASSRQGPSRPRTAGRELSRQCDIAEPPWPHPVSATTRFRCPELSSVPASAALLRPWAAVNVLTKNHPHRHCCRIRSCRSLITSPPNRRLCQDEPSPLASHHQTQYNFWQWQTKETAQGGSHQHL